MRPEAKRRIPLPWRAAAVIIALVMASILGIDTGGTFTDFLLCHIALPPLGPTPYNIVVMTCRPPPPPLPADRQALTHHPLTPALSESLSLAHKTTKHLALVAI